MSSIRDLKRERGDLVKEMRDLKAKADKEGRFMNTDEKKKFDDLDKRQAELFEEIESEERLQGLEKWGATPETTRVVEGTEPGGHRSKMTSNSQFKRKYRDLFSGGTKDGGFGSFRDFLLAVSGKHLDERLVRTMSTNPPSQGGFAVPTEFAREIFDSALELEIIRPRARVYGMTSSELRIPAFDSKNHSSSLYGGLTSQWVGEGDTATDSDAKFRQVLLKSKKLAIYSRVTNELLSDSPNFQAAIGDAMVSAVAFSLDDAFINGDGAGKPLGILSNPALITVLKEGGQSAGTIVTANLVKMLSRIYPSYINENLIWIANPKCMSQLLSLTIGASSSYVPVLEREGGRYFCLGYELFFSEKCPTLGAVGDVILCNPSVYGIGLRQDVALDRSQHVGWQNDTTGFRAILRADGESLLDGPITPKNGDTLSWSVVLEAR